MLDPLCVCSVTRGHEVSGDVLRTLEIFASIVVLDN